MTATFDTLAQALALVGGTAALVCVIIVGLTALKFGWFRSVNWQLLLLSLTGIALSIASGWTTWDGMTNFTQALTLSLLITFGIQGVLLVVSWLIGESLANASRPLPADKNQSHASASPVRRIAMLAAVLTLATIAAVNHATLAPWLPGVFARTANDDPAVMGTLIFAAVFVIAIASLALAGIKDGWGTAAKTATLWLMLAACMFGSVFFSFDSLFSTIFTAGERGRTAALRVESGIAGLLSDLDVLAQKRLRTAEANFLASDAWTAYVNAINELIVTAQGAAAKLQARDARKIKGLRSSQTKLASQLASEQSTRAELKKQLSRDRRARAEQETELAKRQDTLRARKQERLHNDALLARKRLEARLEIRGNGATGRKGRGPVYRAIARAVRVARGKQRQLNIQLDYQQRAIQNVQSRIARLTKRIASTSGKLSRLDGDISSRQSQLTRLRTAMNSPVAAVPKLLEVQINDLAVAIRATRKAPTRAALKEVESICAAMTNRIGSLTAKSNTLAQRCQTSNLTSVISEVARAKSGREAIKHCRPNGSVSAVKSPDARISFARNCIQLSRLPGQSAAADYHRRLNQLAMNRDDQAHRFVVTINAFADGNRLAYLALAIALSIDGLVFASGLFGAFAARSPLSGIPNGLGYSPRKLEMLVTGALAPDISDNAAIALQNMRPIAQAVQIVSPGLGSEWSHELDLSQSPPEQGRVLMNVLAAAGAIGAARQTETQPNVFLIRRQLVEFLLRQLAISPLRERSDLKVTLTQQLADTLYPDVKTNAAMCISNLKPVQSQEGFCSSLCLTKNTQADANIVNRVLNLAASHDLLRQPSMRHGAETVLVHRDVCEALLRLASDKSAQSPVASKQIPMGRTRQADKARQAETERQAEKERVPADLTMAHPPVASAPTYAAADALEARPIDIDEAKHVRRAGQGNLLRHVEPTPHDAPSSSGQNTVAADVSTGHQDVASAEKVTSNDGRGVRDLPANSCDPVAQRPARPASRPASRSASRTASSSGANSSSLSEMSFEHIKLPEAGRTLHTSEIFAKPGNRGRTKSPA